VAPRPQEISRFARNDSWKANVISTEGKELYLPPVFEKLIERFFIFQYWEFALARLLQLSSLDRVFFVVAFDNARLMELTTQGEFYNRSRKTCGFDRQNRKHDTTIIGGFCVLDK